MGTHDWIDAFSVVGVVSSTLGAVLLANRLSQHKAIEDKVNQHESRLAAIENSIDWIRKLFKESK